MTSTSLTLVSSPDPDDEDDPSGEVALAEGEDDDDLGYIATETVAVPHAIDPPAAPMPTVLGEWDVRRGRVLLPAWVKSWASFKYTAWWFAHKIGFEITFHGLKLPTYALRATIRLLVGLGRVIAITWGWLWDAQGRQMGAAAHLTSDQQAWAKARKEWKDTVHRRLIGSAAGTLAALAALPLAYFYLPEQVTALILVILVGLLVRFGKPEDDSPIIDRIPADKAGRAFTLRPDMVIEALTALRIDGMKPSKNQPAEELVEPVTPAMIDGPGWRIDVDLPRGVTAAQVMEKRPELASALRRPLGTVWPSPEPSVHAGRLVLWCGHREISALAFPPPYAKPGWRCDIFEPIPFGFDQRGEPVELTLIYANLLIGAKPGAGKTAAVRGIVAALSLDVTVKLKLADHKGAGDLSMFEPLADVYISGALDEDVEASLNMLRSLDKECTRRGTKLGELAKTTDLAPQSKVTRQTASMKSLGLEPIVCVIDEVQEVMGHEVHGKEAGRLAERIIRKGRALGIILIPVTQRPNKESLPTGITANVARRFCLKVEDQWTNDAILGTSAYKQGIQATTLSPKDEGVGYLKGEFDDARIVRTYYMDNTEATEVAQRALALRKAAGRLTGQALGESPEVPPVASLVTDLPEVFALGADRMHSVDILGSLQTLRPGTYDDWTVQTFAGAVKDQLGLTTKDLKIGRSTKKGLRREWVLGAAAAKLAEHAGDRRPGEMTDVDDLD